MTGIVATSFPSHKARHRAGAGGRPPATTWEARPLPERSGVSLEVEPWSIRAKNIPSPARCTVAPSQPRGASWLLTDSLASCRSREHSQGSCSSAVWRSPGGIRAARQRRRSTTRTGATTAASTRSQASCSHRWSAFPLSSSEQAYSAASGAKGQFRARRRRIRWLRPRRRHVRARRHARGWRRRMRHTRGERQAAYTLGQLHSYDWVAWNAAFAAVLLATGLGVLRNRSAAHATRMGDDRDRRVAHHAARLLRVLPSPALAHRGRALARTPQDSGTRTALKLTWAARRSRRAQSWRRMPRGERLDDRDRRRNTAHIAHQYRHAWPSIRRSRWWTSSAGHRSSARLPVAPTLEIPMKSSAPPFLRRSFSCAATVVLVAVLTACTATGGGQLPPTTGFTGPASFGFSFSCERSSNSTSLNPPAGQLRTQLSYTEHGTHLPLGSPFTIHGIVDEIDPILESAFCIGQNPPPGGNELIFLGRCGRRRPLRRAWKRARGGRRQPRRCAASRSSCGTTTRT